MFLKILGQRYLIFILAMVTTSLEAMLAIAFVLAKRALCMWQIILHIVPRSKNIEIYAKNTQMNQPNDIAISVTNTIYANDPNWQNNVGQLWMVKPHADLVLLEAEMDTTNGVAVCADEKHPYVKESFQRKIWRYDILLNSKVVNKKLFYPFQEHGLDGMRCDPVGNLYVARYGAENVAVLSPGGTFIREVF
jgi:gluconolactonase